MELPILLQAVTCVCTAALGIFVLTKNPRNRINQTLFLACVFLSSWNVCGILMEYQVQNGINPILISRASMMFISLLYPTFIYFSWVFPFQEDNPRYKRMFLFFNFVALVSVFLSLKGFYINQIEIVDRIAIRRFSPWIYYFLISSITSVGAGFYNLLSKYINTKIAIYKNQLKYVFIGLATGFFVALLFSLFLPIMGYNKFFFVGETGALLFVGFTAYSIIKHRLMDIEIIIKKGIIYSLLISGAVGVYALLAITLGQYLNFVTGYGVLLANVLSALAIVLGYKPLETIIENATDRFFFKGKFDHYKTLKNLSREITSIIDINRLLLLIISAITGTMRVSKVSVCLMDDKGRWEEAKLEDENVDLDEVKMDEVLLNYISEVKEAVSFDDIKHKLETQKLTATIKTNLSHIINLMEDMRIVLFVPLIGKKGIIGILSLGEKLSEDMYSLQDLELLSILANQTATAIENARLHQQLERAERLAALGKLASGLAHEIRNPLTSIKAFFQILNSDEDEEDKREIAEIASQEIVRIEGLLDNLLCFARPRPPEYSLIDIREVLDETLAIIKPESTSENIRIVKNYSDSVPMIHADEKQLKQVFMNLMFNALQAMPDGGELGIDLFHDKEKDIVKIKLADSGCGIDKKHLSKLFDPFFTTKAQGTGLGLSICQRIIESHNGRIAIESEKNKGTQVHITLPAGQPAVAQKLF